MILKVAPVTAWQQYKLMMTFKLQYGIPYRTKLHKQRFRYVHTQLPWYLGTEVIVYSLYTHSYILSQEPLCIPHTSSCINLLRY